MRGEPEHMTGERMDTTAAAGRLSREEVAPLWRRERLALRLAGMGLTVFAGLLAWRIGFGDMPAVGLLALAGAGALIVAAMMLPMLARCPRCGAALGRQSLMMLPERCTACGVAVPRPDILDGELDN